jgi:hypothetical protein
MVELELTRAPEDRRVYELGTLGSLRLGGWLMRSATARAGGRSFLFRRAKWFSATVAASDDEDRGIGAFRPSQIRRGGVVQWREAEYSLRPATLIRERYELILGDRQLAVIEATGWWGWGSRRPLKMRVVERDLDPGLLLFVAFVVRTLADNAGQDTAAATSVTTNTGAYGG